MSTYCFHIRYSTHRVDARYITAYIYAETWAEARARLAEATGEKNLPLVFLQTIAETAPTFEPTKEPQVERESQKSRPTYDAKNLTPENEVSSYRNKKTTSHDSTDDFDILEAMPGRPIGPGDDVVASTVELLAWRDRTARRMVGEVIGEDEEIKFFNDDTTYGDTKYRHEDVIWGQNELREQQRAALARLKEIERNE